MQSAIIVQLIYINAEPWRGRDKERVMCPNGTEWRYRRRSEEHIHFNDIALFVCA